MHVPLAYAPCRLSEWQGEASAGDHLGWLSSRESAKSWVPTMLPNRKATRVAAISQVAPRPDVVRDSSKHGHSLRGNWEVSLLAGAGARRRSARGRPQGRSPL